MARKRSVSTDENVSEVKNSEKRIMHPDTLNDIFLTNKQKSLLKVIDDNDIIIITGPAGTSKTFITCYYAIQALKNKSFDTVILTKPIQEAGEKLGALPGTVEDKIDPHYESFRQNLLKFINKGSLEKLVKNEHIIYKPLAYMRGTGWPHAIFVLDECQNANWKQLMLFVTRMGKGSKIILAGDISQHDIKRDMLALTQFSNMTQKIKGVATFEFTKDDIMRHPILTQITDAYEKLKYSGKIKEE